MRCKRPARNRAFRFHGDDSPDDLRSVWALRVRGVLFVLGLGCALVSAQAGESGVEVHHRRLCRLRNREVTESSGLALSRRSAGMFWTHNDSGGTPRLFAFDAGGRDLAVCRIAGVRALDWEDMGAARFGNKPHLIIADTGDNARKRTEYRLIVIEEPAVDTDEEGERITVEPELIVPFRFEGGSRDCEAIAHVPGTRSVLLATKHRGFRCEIYRLELPAESPSEPLTIRRVARVPVPLVTAMDISRDGRRLVLLTYGPASEYAREEKESWAEALKRRPAIIELPERKQGESVAYDARGQNLYVTSEGVPMPLWEVEIQR